jgi:hypothetical protein
MLSNEGIEHFNLLKELINQFWQGNAQINNEEIINAPFDMFKINVTIYKKFKILLEYDRSIIAIKIKENEKFINLRTLTKKETIKGFKSSEKNNMLHNFKILDDTLKSMDNRVQ